MSDYLTPEQVAILLRPLNPKRVSKDGRGFSHLEAYDVRAHLIRVFGFGRWSADLLDLVLVFESEGLSNQQKPTWTVCYRATVRLTVCAPDGTVLATYTEAATGTSKNQPVRGDAHDLAIKTAESQALKRAATNLGDGYGLGLYAQGSLSALVRAVLVGAPEPVEGAPDSHVEQVTPENEASEPPQSPSEVQTEPAAPPGPEPPSEPGPGVLPLTPNEQAMRVREDALAIPDEAGKRAAQIALTKLRLDSTKIKRERVPDRNGEQVTLDAFFQSEIERRTQLEKQTV